MNNDHEHLDDARFDRLVDDELSEEERRELLTRLDDEPNGWRRCALAFLESQCWKQTFGDVEECSPHTPCADSRPAHGVCGLPSRRSPWSGRLSAFAAMAASFLVAFWVGSLVQRARFDHAVAPVGAMGDVATLTPASTRLAPAFTPGASQPGPWRMVTVSAPSGSGDAGSSVRLPAMERDNVDPQWLRSLPSAVPDDVMQAFNRTGHQIEQHRELVPVPLKDGRRLVVPVDQVDVHYVGNGTY